MLKHNCNNPRRHPCGRELGFAKILIYYKLKIIEQIEYLI